MRSAKINRKTKETSIYVELEVDGKGICDIKTLIGFFSHMLESFALHGRLDLKMSAQGDMHVDQHHLIEDCGIALGQAFKKALGEKRGINRGGYFVYPMDDALAVVAVDICGRPYLKYEAELKRRFCGELDTDLLQDFFQAFAVHSGVTLHIKMPYGRSDHHKIEAIFKAFGKAMKMACSLDPQVIKDIPSTKGMI